MEGSDKDTLAVAPGASTDSISEPSSTNSSKESVSPSKSICSTSSNSSGEHPAAAEPSKVCFMSKDWNFTSISSLISSFGSNEMGV